MGETNTGCHVTVTKSFSEWLDILHWDIFAPSGIQTIIIFFTQIKALVTLMKVKHSTNMYRKGIYHI